MVPTTEELNPYVAQPAQDAVEMAGGQSNSIQDGPAAPPRLDIGSIVTIQMRGHTHSPGGLEYYAPAVVLNQYADEYGSIDALVWDAHAGAHFCHGYHVRELDVAVDLQGNRRMVQSKSNIGQLLFDPSAFSQALQDIEQLTFDVAKLRRAVDKLIAGQVLTGAQSVPVTPPLHPANPLSGSSAAATSSSDAGAPKAQPQKK